MDALDTNARSPGLTGGYAEQQYTEAKDDDSCGSPILVIDPEKLSKKSVTWILSEEPSKSEHTGFDDGESSSIITSTPSSSCDSQASVATQTAPDLICRYFSRRTAPLGLYSCNKKKQPESCETTAENRIVFEILPELEDREFGKEHVEHNSTWVYDHKSVKCLSPPSMVKMLS